LRRSGRHSRYDLFHFSEKLKVSAAKRNLLLQAIKLI
jgi:hypothetical protein